MEKRNKFLEIDGLHSETDTHEWFHDKISTQYAHKKTTSSGGRVQDDSLNNLICFVVRDKSTGEYNRVIVDAEKGEVIFDTKSLEDLSYYIDKLKITKRFT